MVEKERSRWSDERPTRSVISIGGERKVLDKEKEAKGRGVGVGW